MVEAPAADFALPDGLIAYEPPERRGKRRDEVRLLVTHTTSGESFDRSFTNLPEVLDPGDLLVVNTSATLPASLTAIASDGLELELHLSTHLPADLWIVELRRPLPAGSAPWLEGAPGQSFSLPN